MTRANCVLCTLCGRNIVWCAQLLLAKTLCEHSNKFSANSNERATPFCSSNKYHYIAGERASVGTRLKSIECFCHLNSFKIWCIDFSVCFCWFLYGCLKSKRRIEYRKFQYIFKTNSTRLSTIELISLAYIDNKFTSQENPMVNDIKMKFNIIKSIAFHFTNDNGKWNKHEKSNNYEIYGCKISAWKKNKGKLLKERWKHKR